MLVTSRARAAQQMAQDSRELVINLTTRAARDLLETRSFAEKENANKEHAGRASTKEAVARVTVNPRRYTHANGDTVPKLRMAVTRSVATDAFQTKILVFQSGRDVLEDMDQGILAAFESEFCELAALPVGRLREKMECLTGKEQRRHIDISHVQHTDLVYEIVRRKDIGAERFDELMFVSIDQSALFLKCDYDAKKNYSGIQNPGIAVSARDLYDVGSGFVIMGPTYRWNQQLISDIPKAVLEEKFYNQPLAGLADDETLVRDVLRVIDDARPLAIVSGFSKVLNDDCVLAGESADILVRAGMGVSFTFDHCPPPLHDAVTCGGNPSLKTCHGFVAGIVDDADGTVELQVRVVLHKGNLPPFLKWTRLSQDAVLQTNLQANIPARWVVSAYRILPIPLHSLPEFPPQEIAMIGNAAFPIVRNVFVAGQLDLIPGALFPAVAQTGLPGSSPDDLWKKRYQNDKLKAFVLLSDFCMRGGKVTDEVYKEHAVWKGKTLGIMQAVPFYRPRAELRRVAVFPPEMALSTIYASERLLGAAAYGPFLFDLHAAARRFAASKAKRAKNGAGSSCNMILSMPGNMLMQLVFKYATVSTVCFKEGAVEAVVEHFHQAEHLLGSKDGVFHREGSGIIRFFAPITARFVLYNPKALPEDTAYVGSGGRAELEFQQYVGMDRHGGELTGVLNDTDPFIADACEGGAEEGTDAPARECHWHSIAPPVPGRTSASLAHFARRGAKSASGASAAATAAKVDLAAPEAELAAAAKANVDAAAWAAVTEAAASGGGGAGKGDGGDAASGGAVGPGSTPRAGTAAVAADIHCLYIHGNAMMPWILPQSNTVDGSQRT